jgi:hypothetical protein
MEESRSPTHLNGVTSCYCSHIIIRYGYVGEIMKNDRFVSTNSREDLFVLCCQIVFMKRVRFFF